MTWRRLEDADPDLAAFGKSRLNGRVSYLGTLQPGGTPRVHPVTPIIGEGHIFLFMEPNSPKGHDLKRGSAFALHCGVEDANGGAGEFLIAGRARAVEEAGTRELAARLASYVPAERYVLFELEVESAVATTYEAAGPARRRWSASTG